MKLRSILCAGVFGFASLPAQAEMTFVRLTPAQYENTIHGIFGPSIEVDATAVDNGFRDAGLLAVGDRKLTLTSAAFERYEALAQKVAAQVLDPKVAPTFMPCAPQAKTQADDACAAQVVNQLGPLLFRRPLRAGEGDTYVAKARESAQKTGDFYSGLGFALAEMLLSPEFLFRIERTNPGSNHLDAYSTATRLAFFLWDSAPDKQLLAAAASGKLATAQGLKQQTERLLNSPRAEAGLRAFFSDMFSFADFATLSKDTNLFPKFTKHVEDDAREQTLRTVVDQLFNRGGDYRDLFTTRKTFLTPELAALYEVPLARSQEMGGATPWVPYEFPEGDSRVGILTQVSFLALHSHPGTTSPTLRGKALRENVMCQKVPPPPGNVDFSIVQDESNPNYKTVRQRLTAHRNNPVCAGCHRITDPIGLAMEEFDSSGVARTTENGVAIDTTGELNGKAYRGTAQLMDIIKDDPNTTACLVTRVFAYGAARAPVATETAWLGELQTNLLKSGVKWRDLIRAVATTPAFYTMPPAKTQSAAAQ